MSAKIIIITSKFLHTFVEEKFAKIQPDCEIEIVEYANFDQLPDIYRRYEDEADGFMISGEVAKSVIEREVGRIKKPNISFHANMVSFYRKLIALFLERRDLDPGRTYFDFLLPLQEEASVEYMLHDIDGLAREMQIEDWSSNFRKGEFSHMEQAVIREILRRWERGDIDMVLCLYSSIVPVLEEKGIPYSFIYPAENQLVEQTQELLAQIQVEKMHDNLPAIIAIADLHPERTKDSRARFAAAVDSIKKELLLDVIIKEENDHYYMFMDYQTMSGITRELKYCCFCPELKKKYQLASAVGYGIGRNITEAKKNADDALKNALFSGGSFIVNEKLDLIGPMESEKRMEVQRDLSDVVCTIAKECHLSTLTVQKLLSIARMNGSPRITTRELAERMGVTIRNANRILQNLEQGGAASIAYTHSANTKGRPVKVYELHVE